MENESLMLDVKIKLEQIVKKMAQDLQIINLIIQILQTKQK